MFASILLISLLSKIPSLQICLAIFSENSIRHLECGRQILWPRRQTMTRGQVWFWLLKALSLSPWAAQFISPHLRSLTKYVHLSPALQGNNLKIFMKFLDAVTKMIEQSKQSVWILQADIGFKKQTNKKIAVI